MTNPSAVAPRLRVDASRNRTAIVNAAGELFAQHGLDASLEEIARQAGVGSATLHRRFRTRTALIEAVYTAKMASYASLTRQALHSRDPWQAFQDCVLALLKMQAEDIGFADLMSSRLADDEVEVIEAARTGASEALHEVIRRAQAKGRLRRDFTHGDLLLLLMTNAALCRRTAGAAPGAWRRLATLVIDGLQTEPSEGDAAPIPTADLHRAMARISWSKST